MAGRIQTLDDINAIVTNNIPESLTLEYKSSTLLGRQLSNEFCKAVSAFANSTGGQLVFGINSSGGRPVSLDGGFSGPPQIDRLQQIINSGTQPPVECAQIKEVLGPSGSYYIVTVDRSAQAPHQSADKKYYKRKGGMSEPMEHYEIEDVRTRPKRQSAPLRVGIYRQEAMGYLHFRNEHEFEPVKKIRCSIDANFELKRDGLGSVCKKGVTSLAAGEELFFVLDFFGNMLNEKADAQLDIRVEYDFYDVPKIETLSFYVADIEQSAIMRSPLEKRAGEMIDAVKKITERLDKMSKSIEDIAHIADGTGLRISTNTLRLQKGEMIKYDPLEFDWKGYQSLLNINSNEAVELSSVFWTIDTRDGRKKRYLELSSDLRAAFERLFRVDFED